METKLQSQNIVCRRTNMKKMVWEGHMHVQTDEVWIGRSDDSGILTSWCSELTSHFVLFMCDGTIPIHFFISIFTKSPNFYANLFFCSLLPYLICTFAMWPYLRWKNLFCKQDILLGQVKCTASYWLEKLMFYKTIVTWSCIFGVHIKSKLRQLF